MSKYNVTDIIIILHITVYNKNNANNIIMQIKTISLIPFIMIMNFYNDALHVDTNIFFNYILDFVKSDRRKLSLTYIIEQ